MIKTVFVLLLALSLTAPARADYASAVEAYERGDYKAAFNELWRLANAGDAKAQTRLGLMYREGKGVTPDSTAGLAWLTKAAEQGRADAQFLVGTMHLRGEGTLKDESAAITWLRKAADQGQKKAQASLDAIYRRAGMKPPATATGPSGASPPSRTSTAASDVKPTVPGVTIPAMDPPASTAEEIAINKAAQHGITVRYGSLSVAEGSKSKTETSTSRAASRSISAPSSLQDVMKPRVQAPTGPVIPVAEAPPPQASVPPVVTNSDAAGKSADRPATLSNEEFSFKQLQQRAQQGDPSAQRRLGSIYLRGDGVGSDLEQAARWYRKAAQQGDPDAQYVLSGMYLQGVGVPKDKGVGLAWLRKAAAQGHARAKAKLAQLNG